MRVLLCGAGQIGSVHAANLARAEAVSELLVADVDPARAEALAAQVSARPAPAGDPFAAAPDAVVVAAATPAHAGLVRHAIELGAPCFCEKPLCAGVEETVSLVRDVERAGAVVQVGFMRRFDPGVRALRALIAGGDLGRLHVVHIASHDHEPPSEKYVARSGGMFRDQMIHDFDMVRWATGEEVRTVYAAGGVRIIEFAARHGDVDTCALVLELGNGAFVLMAGTREDGRGEDVRIEAIGSRDSAAAGLNARTPLRLLEPDGVERGHTPFASFLDRFAAAYAAEMEHFLALAEGRAENPCPPRDALQALLVAVAAEESRAARAPVDVRLAADLL